MDEFISVDTIAIYIATLVALACIYYTCLTKNTGPFNFLDSLFYQIFLVGNFFSVIIVLFYLNFVSIDYLFLYCITFLFLFAGVFIGARFKFNLSTISSCDSIFSARYFYIILSLALAGLIFSLFINISTWSLDGDAQLNRIDIYRDNAIFFYFFSAVSFSINIYIFLSIFLCNSFVQKRLAVVYVIISILVGLTGASRSGMVFYLFQISLAAHILKNQGFDFSKSRKFKAIIFLIIIFAISSMVYISILKDDVRGPFFSLLERLIYSADNVIYFHVFLSETFAYHLESSYQYFLHPLLKALGIASINGGIGATMSAEFSGEMTGRGPVASFIYDGMFVFGNFGMPLYAFLVGIFISAVRNIVNSLAATGLIIKDMNIFFISTFSFSLCLVLINDLLTFITFVFIATPLILAFLFLSAVYDLKGRSNVF